MNFSKWIPKKKSEWMILLVIGVLLMLLAIPTDGRKSDEMGNGTEEAAGGMEKALTVEEYVRDLENRLSGTLSKMKGAGEVEVMITLRDEGESRLNKDITRDEKRYEENTTLTGKGEGSMPYVTSRRVPEVEGVVVVAEGAADAQVRTEITESVLALFSVETHRVKVLVKE